MSKTPPHEREQRLDNRVAVDKGASESARRAANELTSALNDTGIEAIEDDQNNNPTPTDKIYMSVGIKPEMLPARM
jgi:hypothetical protein